jgi:hypothetical protein
MMTRNWTGGFAGFLIFLFQAGAAEAVDATISTQVCEPLKQNAALQLTPADDSDLYLSVQAGLDDVLRKIGHPVDKKAALDMYYSLVETAVEIRGEGPTLGRLDVRTVNRDARAQLLVNLWSNQKDSILGGKRTESGVRVSNVLIVTLELNGQQDGRCIWRGEGAVELGTITSRDVADELTQAVAKRIGEAIDGVTIPLH